MSIVLGVAGGFGHDASACLLVDGKLASLVEEERLSRKKKSPEEAAVRSILASAASAGIELESIDILSLSWDNRLAPNDARMRLAEERLFNAPELKRLRPKTIARNEHHLCHAASAIYFRETASPAVVVVADGRGELYSTSVFFFDGQGFQAIGRSSVDASLGTFYAAATEYCGCGQGGQGKVMALAAFGSPTYDFCELESRDLSVALSEIAEPGAYDFRGSTRSRRLSWLRLFTEKFGEPRPWPSYPRDLLYADFPRFEQRHADAAASAQLALERVLVNLCRNVMKRYPGVPILLSGGVALNCTMNSRIRESLPEIDLGLNPIPADSGSSLGAAALVTLERQGSMPDATSSPFLGLGWSDEQLRMLLDSLSLKYIFRDPPADDIAESIADARIVGLFLGNAEVGPRALGHRSILASASVCETARRVNLVKGREPWRPFGPSILLEDMGELSVDGRAFPYMIEAAAVGERFANRFPNVLHVDSTTRPQSVDRSADLAQYRGKHSALI